MSEEIASDATIDRAVMALRRGELVAFPTETVYGLGADAVNDTALHTLYHVKRRPVAHPVIVHVGSAALLDRVGLDVSDDALRLAEQFWPGPLTVIVRLRPAAVSTVATGGLDTVGVRVPDHPVALELLARFDGGVAAPSANRFGRVSPTTAAHVRADLGDDVSLVLDGGAARVGVESTIVDCTGRLPVILRAGGVSSDAVQTALGKNLGVESSTRAPGTLASHYAPRAVVELVGEGDFAARVAYAYREGESVGVLALASVIDRAEFHNDIVRLARPGDVAEYAHVLYRALREADALGLDRVIAVAPSADGVGAAVTDRLRRASHR